MPNTFVITAKIENVLRVLQKLTSLMSRKRLKIQDMQVSEISSSGEAYLSLTLQADADHVQWLAKQMKKCVDLFDLDLKLPSEAAPHTTNRRREISRMERIICPYVGYIF